MLGVLFAVIAGAAMSFQGVFNTNLSDKIGLYESNAFVQGSAFVLSLAVMFLFGKGNFGEILHVNKLYWLGGVLGIVITVTVMLAIGHSSPTLAISVILVAQLLVAAMIDAFGWFGAEKVAFGWHQYVGVGVMILGILLFKQKSV